MPYKPIIGPVIANTTEISIFWNKNRYQQIPCNRIKGMPRRVPPGVGGSWNLQSKNCGPELKLRTKIKQ